MEETLYTDPDGDQIRLATAEGGDLDHHHLAIQSYDRDGYTRMVVCLPKDEKELTELMMKLLGKLLGPGAWIPDRRVEELAEKMFSAVYPDQPWARSFQDAWRTAARAALESGEVQ